MEQILNYILVGFLAVAAIPYVIAFMVYILEIIKVIIGYILAVGLFFCIGFLITQTLEYFTNISHFGTQNA